MNRIKVLVVNVILISFLGFIVSCNLMGTNQVTQEESTAHISDSEIIENGGPFSILRHKYIDKAIYYESSKNGTSRSIMQRTVKMTLKEKVDLLTSLTNYRTSRNAETNTQIEDDSFYKELSSQLLTETEGVILVSSDPLDFNDDQISGFKSPTVQEIDGTAYSTLEILSMAESDSQTSSTQGSSRGLTRVSTRKWGSEIRYRFEDSVSSEAKENIRSAMSEWQNAANNKFTFKEINNDGWHQFLWVIGDNHLRILTDSSDSNIGGAATLGKGSWKMFNIVSGDSMRTCRHELGHVLGLEHEQCRYDRDSYITVNYSNIKDYNAWWNKNYYRSQFNKIELGHNVYLYITIRVLWWSYSTRVNLGYVETSRVYAPFDYNSVMIYSSWAFSKNGLPDVMTRKDGGLIYTNTDISNGDITSIRAMYP